jgi:hypothetical protein
MRHLLLPEPFLRRKVWLVLLEVMQFAAGGHHCAAFPWWLRTANGFVVPVEDPSALSPLLLLIRDEPLRKRMGEEGRRIFASGSRWNGSKRTWKRLGRRRNRTERMRLLVTGDPIYRHQLGAKCLDKGVEVLNLDWNPPLKPAHAPWWRGWDIMDRQATDKHFAEFRPTHVVHLAARTDTDVQDDIDAYGQNHEGTAILLEAVKASAGNERLIVTSTQFVCEAYLSAQGRPGLQALHALW